MSFFGNLSLPDDLIARERAQLRKQKEAETELNGLDEQLEANDDLAAQLNETEDNYNDETFADDAGEIDRDFDFYQNTLMHQNEITDNVSADLSAKSLLAQLDAKSNQAATSSTNAGKKVLTLEEVEAQMLQNIEEQKRKAKMELKAQRKAQRERRRAEQAKYNNIMTNYDKKNITRIQIAQLVVDDPVSEDFYNHMYQLMRGRQASVSGSGSSNSRGKHVQGGLTRMHQQVQRMVNETKNKAKNNQVTLEGVLGKISLTSSRNPKQAIQVNRQGTPGPESAPSPVPDGTGEAHGQAGTPKPPSEVGSEKTPSTRGYSYSISRDARRPETDRRNVLRVIEKVYTCVLKLEQMTRDRPKLPQVEEHPDVVSWRQAFTGYQDEMWQLLDVKQPLMDVHPHPFVRFLSIPKGKQIIPRVAHYLLPERMLALLTTLVANFESLDVCRAGRSAFRTGGTLDPKRADQIEVFMQALMPPIIVYVSETPLYIINGLLALFMERNDVSWVCKTKPGMVIMTMFLSRIEIIKQQVAGQVLPQAGPVPHPTDPQEIYRSHELYSLLFERLSHQFASILPSQSTLSRSPQSIGNDTYIWQFLASLAVGATPEQQRVLVEAVQEKVLYAANLATKGFLPPEASTRVANNVNLFLKALGLDLATLNL
ncbi:DNA topoisomerase 2-associated protein pat1 [Mycoemilia scoparia]|uniref:DNA topoisomerase 2-associated protein pat1 n=1 Tax=Mycoemilia scoparia TaxID=417184 RepID=A0A9W8DR91_9FUNG|nr:DNA topoisomerase 2-associated protein pat1 [Mycoemilia scoparia]